MLWVGLHLPELSLAVYQRGLAVTEAAPGTAQAVCHAGRILLPDAAAAALGVQPGMKRATAQALVPALVLRERDPDRERRLLEQIATWALQFTPMVSLVGLEDGIDAKTARASGLLLEIEPSLRLFGGLPTLLAQLAQGLAAQGLTASIAHAPTAGGAWLMARHRDGWGVTDIAELTDALAPLPLALLEAALPHLGVLESVGARTLGDLQRLPRPGLARRFGKALLTELDRAFARQPDPRLAFEAPATFRTGLELFAQVEHAQALLFGAHRLLLLLTGWLAARQAATRQLLLEALHDDAPPTRIEIRLAEPSRDPARIVALVRERLGVVQLPEPVHSLRLACDESVPLAEATASLFPTSASSRETLGRLIERLQARLGREQIRQLQVTDDHRPEDACRLELIEDLSRFETRAPRGRRRGGAQATAEAQASVGARPAVRAKPSGVEEPPRVPSTADAAAGGASSVGGASAAGGAPAAGGPAATGMASADGTGPATHGHGALPRPMWMLSTPIPLTERNHRPFWQTPLTLLAGPERIESGWWDGRHVQRDYFIAEDDQHVLYWIYRERLPDAQSRQGWFMQGRFG